MWSNKTRCILFFLYAFCIAVGIAISNPVLFRSTLLFQRDRLSSLWSPVYIDQNNTPNPRPFVNFYRHDEKRQAVFKIPFDSFELKPLWKTESLNVGIHSASKASVMSDEGQVYVGSDSSWFYAFTKKGELRWKAFLAGANLGIHSTAAVDENSVYVGSYSGTLYCFNKFTGEPRWSRDLGQTLGASPFIDGNSILASVETVPRNGFLIKLDKKNGKTLWKTHDLGDQAHSSPSLDVQKNIVIVGTNNKDVQAFDFSDGHALWTLPVAGAVKSTVLLHGDRGYVSSWGQDLTAFEIQSGKPLWKALLSTKSQVSPVYLEKENLVFVADHSGQGFAFDAQDGTLKWKMNTLNKDQTSSPIVIQGPHHQKIIFYCLPLKLCRIDTNGRVEAAWPVSGPITGSSLIDNDKLFVSYDEGGLEAFELLSNQPQKSHASK